MKDAEHKNAATELSALLNRGYSTLLNNLGKAVAVITATVSLLLTFTDVTFGNFSSECFTSSLAVMLISSYLIYFSLESAGEKFGEGTVEYRTALEYYKSVSDKIGPDAIEAVRDFSAEYAKGEGEYRRRVYLASRGLSLSELDEWKSGKRFSKSESRVLKRASKIREKTLTPTLLLSVENARHSELENPERSKFFALLLKLVPSTLGTVFTVSVMLTAKDGLTAPAVIEGILKLSALPIIGFNGYTTGYEYVKNKKSQWLMTKARILEAFIKSRE